MKKGRIYDNLFEDSKSFKRSLFTGYFKERG
jgi:hypothetical protein